MKNIHLIAKIAIHLALWHVMFFMNYFLLRNSIIEVDFLFQISLIAIYAVVFYANYYFLMPLLFHKKYILYAFLALLLIIGATTLKDISSKKERELVRQQLELKQIIHPRPDFLDNNPNNRHRPDEGFIRKQFLFNAYGVLLVFILSFSIRFVQKWQDNERQKSELEKENIKTELSFLKQQINPHFLFNSLNSIYSLAITKSDKTVDMILKLSSILRYMLYETENSQVSLQNELKIIEDYIELQKIRLTDKVSVQYEVAGESANYKIEPFILIPLIENAFKHGTDNVNQSFINIKINISHKKIEAIIANTIVSKSTEKKTDSGIGVQNIQRRLELLYPAHHTFETIQASNIFTVSLSISLQ